MALAATSAALLAVQVVLAVAVKDMALLQRVALVIRRLPLQAKVITAAMGTQIPHQRLWVVVAVVAQARLAVTQVGQLAAMAVQARHQQFLAHQ